MPRFIIVKRRFYASGRFDKEKVMAKGNNSQKNDKKNKKPKADAKKKEVKPLERPLERK